WHDAGVGPGSDHLVLDVSTTWTGRPGPAIYQGITCDPGKHRHGAACRPALPERFCGENSELVRWDWRRKRGVKPVGLKQATYSKETMTRETKDLIVALDIGTSKVVAVVAEMLPDGRFEVLGLGQHESRGMRKGVVVNIETTVNSIQRALEEAELMADCKIRDVFTGIAGSHIRSFNSSGMVAVKDKEVTATDVARVIETAKAVNIPTDQQVLHVLTQEFIVDGQEDIREPIGMSGLRLEVRVHIVTGAVSAAQNIVKCVRRCGLEVQDLILQPLASSLSCLTSDEKELGVVLVDIGGGTTDVAIFTGGAIRHTAVLPIAGDQITNDIAAMLRTPTPDAEEI